MKRTPRGAVCQTPVCGHAGKTVQQRLQGSFRVDGAKRALRCQVAHKSQIGVHPPAIPLHLGVRDASLCFPASRKGVMGCSGVRAGVNQGGDEGGSE